MPAKSLCQIKEILVGQAKDHRARTACTVIPTPEGAAAFTLGFAADNRGMEILRPDRTAPGLYGLVLGGGVILGPAADAVNRAIDNSALALKADTE